MPVWPLRADKDQLEKSLYGIAERLGASVQLCRQECCMRSPNIPAIMRKVEHLTGAQMHSNFARPWAGGHAEKISWMSPSSCNGSHAQYALSQRQLTASKCGFQSQTHS